MSKERLLITMGCSFTEGVGCWDMNITPPTLRTSHIEYYSFLERKENRYKFHKDGWPNRVGKKIGFDKVINIGKGGDSTSGQVKRFINKILPMDLSKYDVLVLFQLPQASRFSFYSNGLVNSWGNYNAKDTPLVKEYIKLLKDEDFLHEQLFYIKIMAEVCENNSFKFLTVNLIDEDSSINFYERNISNKIYKPQVVITGYEEISKICNHYNEHGYEMTSIRISGHVKSKLKEIANLPKKEDIEWEYIE